MSGPRRMAEEEESGRRRGRRQACGVAGWGLQGGGEGDWVRGMVRRNLLAVAVLLAGCLQMAGYLTERPVLRGIGAASGFAPFPKVFSDVDGFETFAADFTLRGLDGEGRAFALEITPEVYARLEGPYNRRNVYGAALSYAPRLPEPLWQAVWCYGLGEGGPLREEFGLPPGAHALAMTITTRTKGRNDSWVLSPSCTR